LLTQISLTSGFASPTAEGWIRPRVRFRRYPNDSEFDSNDKFVDFQYAQDFEKSRFGVIGNFSREEVRTGELALVGLDPDEPELPDDDTSIVDEDTDRSRLRIFPRWETQLTEQSAIRLRGRLYDVEYDDNQEDRLRDYTDIGGEAQYRYGISPVTTLVAGVFAREFTPSGQPDIYGYGFETGFEHDFSLTTRLTALVGIEHSEPDEGSSSDDWIADISVRRRLQTTWLLARYRRNVSAQGDGDLSIRDEIHLGFTRQLTELIEAGIGVRGYTADGVSGDANDRDYVQIRTEFEWDITRRLSMIGDYRYTILDREEENESANANQLFVYLQYSFGDAD
jgi:hypothetical protein